MTTAVKRIHIPKTKPGLIGFDVRYQITTSKHNHWVEIEAGGFKVGAIVTMNRSGKENEIAKIHKTGQLKFVNGGLCWPHDCKVVR